MTDLKAIPAAAGEAYARHDWQEAYRVLREADADGMLDAEGLRVLGKTAEWMSDRHVCLEALERSYGSFLQAGNPQRASHVALMLVHTYRNLFSDGAAAGGWLNRAARLLSELPECVEHGWLAARQASVCFREGRFDEGRQQCARAIDIGTVMGDANLLAMTLAWEGIWLATHGERQEGWVRIDEACAAAMGGELGPFATGIVYCNAISAYRDLGEYGRAAEWTEAASRWCARQSIAGFPGICRVHGAELLRLRGAWRDAEREAQRACDELSLLAPAWGAEALYEIGEVRLRAGDYEGAGEAFQQAHGLGRDPQPGASLLLLKRGETQAALASILHVDVEQAGFPPIEQARILATRVEIALAAGKRDVARSDVSALETLCSRHPTCAMNTLFKTALGSLQLAEGEQAAQGCLREALRGWQELSAPYEAAVVRVTLAETCRQQGDNEGARRELEAARATFEQLGAADDAVRASEHLSALGRRVGPLSPTICCFMFTDIVASTQLVEAIGDEAWAELLSWHDRLLRSCFADFGGEELDHAGDGFFVSFLDPEPALSCAIAIQRTLRDNRRNHGFAPRVRIGLHSADALRVDNAYRGMGVHEASRIASIAQGDEIIASSATVTAGTAISNPREVRVKGISTPVQLVTIDWEE
ncbi:MAG: adenylate/guanylate cyclase domain-containing protein [Acidimicrobiales bacterium]